MKSKPSGSELSKAQIANEAEFAKHELPIPELFKEILRKNGIEKKAGEVMKIINEVATERQKEVFMLYVEYGSSTEVANIIHRSHAYVEKIVKQIREKVKARLQIPHI